MNTWEYAESIESSSIVSIEKKYGIFFDGQFQSPNSKKYLKTISPSTEEVLSSVALGNKSDIDSAVESAKSGLKVWSKLSGTQRAKYLFKLARLIQERSREFAVLESLDGGKPIKESRDFDLPQVAANFFYFAGWADKLDISWNTKGLKPYGIVGQIIPWNFPLLMLSWKVAPALATGNVVILKPAESTPLTALLFAELCQEVGLPPGVFNLVTGDGTTGRVIDCGFSSGARFVMVRTYTLADNWWIFDTERGIVAGNDPRLYLNTTDAEATTADLVDPHSSGFIVNSVNGEMNYSGRGYIFYAIA